jgi:hypothetical protein
MNGLGSSVGPRLAFEGKQFPNVRHYAIAWERGDMHEDVGLSVGRRDESEPAFAVPL